MIYLFDIVYHYNQTDNYMFQDSNMYHHSNIRDCIQLKLDSSFTILFIV